MLVIWTAARAATVDKTLGRSLKNFRPNVPPHKFLSWQEGAPPPEPQTGDVILACGGKPLSTLQQAGLAPKNRKVASLRETPIARNGGNYLVTYDPAIILSEPEKREIIDWDVRLAHRLMTTGTMNPTVGQYDWVSDYVQLISEIKAEYAQTGKPVKVAFDTETMGLHPWYPDKDFVCISFTHKPGYSALLYLGQKQPHPVPLGDGLFEQIEWLLTTPMIRMRGANLKYDLIWVKEKWGIECTNFTFDTLLVGSLIDENRSNSLNLHAKLMTTFGGYDDEFNRTHDKSRMELVPTEPLRIYQGGDTDAAYRSADVLQAELDDDPALKKFYVTVLHPAARAFEKIERRGVLVDQQKFEVLRDDLKKAIKELQDAQMTLLPVKMRIKYKDRIEEQLAEGKNPMLPSIVKEFFFSPAGLNLKPQQITEKTGQPSLTKGHLRQVSETSVDGARMVAEMTVGDVAAKTLSTFVDGFLKHLRPDGRWHPSYMLFHGGFGDDEDDELGTVTGRLSAKEPAFQVTPKKTKWAKRIRECIIAPKGKKIFAIDYSQGELKVVASVAPEPTMIQAYLDGRDLHAVTGAKLAGVTFEEFITWKKNKDKELAALYEKHRGNAKPANFGLLYGQMAPGFQALRMGAVRDQTYDRRSGSYARRVLYALSRLVGLPRPAEDLRPPVGARAQPARPRAPPATYQEPGLQDQEQGRAPGD